MHHPLDEGFVGLVAGAAHEGGGSPVGSFAEHRWVHVALDRLEVLGTGQPRPVVAALGHRGDLISPFWLMHP